jgi:hypothetical protein
MSFEQLKLGLKPKPLKLEFRTETKTVDITRKFVNVEGEEFEVNDLFNVLDEIEAGCDIEITNKRMADHLVKIEVLKSTGSRRWMTGATKGPCFKFLYERLEDECYKEEE